jgi:hypothetical protein
VRVLLSLLGAVAAACCFGVASVLQASAARAVPAGGAIDPRLLVRVVGQWRYLLGLGLDGLGFLAELAALRGLPLFVVQAAVAASLAVTAVTAVVLLHTRLAAREWLAVAGVCLGLALLGMSAGEEGPARTGTAFRLATLAAVPVLVLLAAAATRLPPARRAAVYGPLAGLAFGLVALCARILPSLAPLALLREPAAYALAGGGVLGMLLLTSALQVGAVTIVTAGLVLGETLAPALVGVTALGDRTRPGFAGIATAGFALAVAATLALAHFGEVPAEPSRAGY